MRLLDFLAKLGISEIDEVLPAKLDMKKIEKMNQPMTQLQSVTMCLQRGDSTVAESRVLFDNFMEHIPGMSKRLAKDGSIAESPDFEQAIVKLQSSCVSKLTNSMRIAEQIFKLKPENENDGKETTSAVPLVDMAIWKHIMEKKKSECYMHILVLSPLHQLSASVSSRK